MDDHAAYVRAEWRLFHERNEPLARLAPSARRVLDVGCGAGQELLAFPGATTVGIDVRKDGLLAGRTLFREAGRPPPSLLLAPAEALPFRDASFDAVICRLALPYTDVRRSLAEMARVLRPGGALVLQIHALAYYLRRAREAQGWRDVVHAARAMVNGAIFLVTGWQPGEVFLQMPALSRALAAAGVRVVQCDGSDPGAPVVLGHRV